MDLQQYSVSLRDALAAVLEAAPGPGAALLPILAAEVQAIRDQVPHLDREHVFYCFFCFGCSMCLNNIFFVVCISISSFCFFWRLFVCLFVMYACQCITIVQVEMCVCVCVCVWKILVFHRSFFVY